MGICCTALVQQTLLFLSITTSLSVFQASSLSVGNSSILNLPGNVSLSGPPRPLSDSNPSTSLISPEDQVSHVENASLRFAFVECNGRLYGRPIAASCLDAWQIMPGSEKEVTFADRSQEISSDVALPWRFPSCELLKYCRNGRSCVQLTVDTADATCNFEVIQETMAGRDVARPFDLKMAAFNIYRKCIHGPSPLVRRLLIARRLSNKENTDTDITNSLTTRGVSQNIWV